MIYISGYMGEGARGMLRDIENDKDVTLVPTSYKGCESARKRHAVRKLVKGIGKVFGNKAAERMNDSLLLAGKYPYTEEDTLVLFNSALSVGMYGRDFLQKVKDTGCKLVLYIVDQFTSKWVQDILPLIPMFDSVYCIDRTTCEEQGYKFQSLIYSKIDVAEDTEKSDLYFMGQSSERDRLLSEIADMLMPKGVQLSFYVKTGDKERLPGIHYFTESVSYRENLGKMAGSHCILEIMHSGFNAPTQRYMEAVVYNKKLLTNNENVVNLPYYDDRYIHVFRQASDIDADWLKDEEPVDYDYKNDFSPLLFLERIKGE